MEESLGLFETASIACQVAVMLTPGSWKLESDGFLAVLSKVVGNKQLVDLSKEAAFL
jgi:hypothetical protein